jgi:O-antigen/teichoic acid export membrane protein
MKLDKAFLMLTFGRIAQAALALIAIRILTTFLDKENVGMTYVVAGLVFYFSLIFINPVGMYLNRKLHQWFREKELRAAFSVLNWYFLGVAFFSIPVVLFSYFVLRVGTGYMAWQLCLLVFLNIYAGTWFQTLCPTLNMLEHRGAFVVINLVSQLAGLIGSIVGVMFIERTAFVWLLGILGGQSLGAILSWIYFRGNVESRKTTVPGSPSLFFNRSVFYFCFPIAITTAFMWGQTQSYRLIVEAEMGAEALGILGVGLGVAASIAGLIESIVSQYFFPQYYATISVEGVKARAKAWRLLSLNALSVYIPTTLFIVFGAPFILRILVSTSFAESLSLVAWGALVEFLRMTTNLLYSISQSEMKTKATILPYAVGAVTVLVGLGLCLHFAVPMKVIYVPMIMAGAGILSCLSMYLNMRRILEIQLDLRFIFLSVLLSLPLSGMLLLKEYAGSLIESLFMCGIFGSYLLFAIWQLNRRIELVEKSAG